MTVIQRNKEQVVAYLQEQFGLTGVKPTREDLDNQSSNYTFYEGRLGEDRVFIKWGGNGLSAWNEFEFGSRLSKLNCENFYRPRFYQCDKEARCIGLDYIESQPLGEKLDDLTDAEKEQVIRQLAAIGKTLLEANCAHRDINPANLVLTPEGRLILVDMEFAVTAAPYVEREDFLQNPRTIFFLGTGAFKGGFRFSPGRFKWDDMFSLLQMLKYIGRKESYSVAYDEAERFFTAHLGERLIEFPGRARLMRMRKFYQLASLFVPGKKQRDKIRMGYLKPRVTPGA